MTEYFESLNDLYRACSKPIMAITELNMRTMNHILSKNESADELFNIKKPEDFMNLCSKYGQQNSAELAKYAQDFSKIVFDSAADSSSMLFNLFNTAARQAQKTAESATKRTTPNNYSSARTGEK